MAHPASVPCAHHLPADRPHARPPQPHPPGPVRSRTLHAPRVHRALPATTLGHPHRQVPLLDGRLPPPPPPPPQRPARTRRRIPPPPLPPARTPRLRRPLPETRPCHNPRRVAR